MDRMKFKVKKAVFIFVVCSLFLAGSFQSALSWKLNKVPRVRERNSVVIDDQKTVSTLKEIRKKIREKGYNFTVGETWVYKLPPERRKKMLGAIPFHIDESSLKKVSSLPDLPSSFDWRDTNKVTSVKNQGICGSCITFAAIADLESKVLINEGTSYDFSEQNLLSCNFYGYDCIRGSIYHKSTNFLTQRGAFMESCSSYQGVEGVSCNDNCEIIKIVDGWRLIANDVDTIKAALYNIGPIATTMFASDPAFHAYLDGVYEFYDLVITNHAVLIVGWDDNLGPNGAWIVKNSWGTDWGVDGYFYIAYGAAAIGTWSNYISSYKDYDGSEILIYYDEGGIAPGFSSIGAGSPTAWFTAIFTPSITGTLSTIDFWAVSDDAFYEIRVYDEMVNGTMENLLAIQEGKCEKTGYYSIPLFIPVSVTSGDDFVVSIKLTTPGYNFPIPVDISGPAEPDMYYLSEDGTSWKLIGADTEIPYDVAIRARVVQKERTGWPSIYGMMLEDDEDNSLFLLRNFRDDVLIPHQAGNKYVNLLYKNSEEIATLLLENPSLALEAGELIDRLLPDIRNLLEGGVMKLSGEEISSIESLLTQCEIEASPRLMSAIRKVKRDIRKGNLFKQLGIVMSE